MSLARDDDLRLVTARPHLDLRFGFVAKFIAIFWRFRRRVLAFPAPSKCFHPSSWPSLASSSDYLRCALLYISRVLSVDLRISRTPSGLPPCFGINRCEMK